MQRLIITLIAGGALALVVPGCSSSPKAQKKSSSTTETDPPADTTGTDTTTCPVTTGTVDGTTSTATTLRLTDTPTYASVKAILQANCTSCHVSGGTGGTDFTQDSYVAGDASNIVARVKSTTSPMPPAGSTPLSATDIQTLQAWLDGGASTTDSSTSGTTTSDTTASSTADPCAVTTTVPAVDGGSDTAAASSTSNVAPDAAFFDTFFNPTAVQDCKTKGFLFNRKTHACSAAKAGTYSCDYNGILTAAGNNAAVKTALDSYQTKGYTFDQCGVLNDQPFIFLVCITTTDGGPCVTRDQANTASVTLHASCMTTATLPAGQSCIDQ